MRGSGRAILRWRRLLLAIEWSWIWKLKAHHWCRSIASSAARQWRLLLLAKRGFLILISFGFSNVCESCLVMRSCAIRFWQRRSRRLRWWWWSWISSQKWPLLDQMHLVSRHTIKIWPKMASQRQPTAQNPMGLDQFRTTKRSFATF